MTNRGINPEPGSFIPRAWQREVLEQMFQHSLEAHEEVMEWLKSQPRSPWHRRKWNLFKWRIEQAREWLALKIAPWLERQEW